MNATPSYIRFQKTHPATIPPAGYIDFYYDNALGRMVRKDSDGLLHSPEIPDAEPAQWGNIIGDINAQTDLHDALNLKFNKSGGTITGNVTVSLVLQTMGLLVSDTVTFAATTYSYAGGPTGPQAAAHRTALGIVAADPDFGLRSSGDTDDTLVLEDRYVRYTGPDDVTVTVPNDTQLDFPVGTKITLRQVGNGTVLVTEGPGVTIHGQLSTAGRHRSLGLIKVGPNEWDTERGAF